MTTVQARIDALDHAAWRLRYSNRDQLRVVVDEMLRIAPPESREAALALYHEAVWTWQANRRDESRVKREQAAQMFARLRDVAGIANCQDLASLDARLSGNLDLAERLCIENCALPEGARLPAEHCVCYTGAGAVQFARGQHDDCQRTWSMALAYAQKADNPGLEVSTLCNLGGWNISVCNFEDGRRLSERAFDLAQRIFEQAGGTEVTTGWINSGMNLLVALDCLGLHTEAMAVFERVVVWEKALPPTQLANYYVTFASALLHAGEVRRAEHYLRASLVGECSTTDFALEQSIVQAEIWNQRGDFEATRDICARLLRDRDDTVSTRDVSAHDLMRFYNAATLANESLGNFEAALEHQKAAFEKYEELVGKSARARRLTLEIQTELQRTEWQRDQALRMRHAAERERERLAELNIALETASSAKSGFLAAASHDLRQPVHAVSLLADTLAQRLAGNAQQSELVSRIAQSTAALQRLLSELLDISELDAGATAAHIAALPIADLMLTVDGEFRDAATAQGLELRMVANDVWVKSDATHLLRILRNLVANALAYTQQGGVLIAARARNNELLLEVWDTGMGIEARHLPQLFEEFYQVGNHARDRRKGLGLGLAIVKRLADLLGHRVEVQSRPGRGTVVRVVLPLA